MLIMKFGGTSIRDATAMQNVARIIEAYQSKKPLVVLSAMAGVTDILESALKHAVKEHYGKVRHALKKIESKHTQAICKLFSDPSVRETLLDALNNECDKLRVLFSTLATIKVASENIMHAVLSTGEILSSLIMNALLQTQGVNCIHADARKFMITTNPSQGIHPLPSEIKQRVQRHIVPQFSKAGVVITQGYIAATREGIPTTLGRNGSDYSASLLGAALAVEEIQIWTDVNGILTADPSIIPYARPLREMSFEEACELAYFGARVLHPASIQPALDKGIKVRVLNSHFPDERGTVILPQAVAKGASHIRSIAYKENITMVTIQSSRLLFSPEVMERFFHSMTEYGKHVYAVNKSATKLSLTVEKEEHLNRILKDFKGTADIIVEAGKAIVSVVGDDIRNNPVIIWQIIKILSESGIRLELISQMSSQISFMFIIDEKKIEQTVKLLHQKFIEKYW